MEAFYKSNCQMDQWGTVGLTLVQSEGLIPNAIYFSLEAPAAVICFLPACSESDFTAAEDSQLTSEDSVNYTDHSVSYFGVLLQTCSYGRLG